MTLSELGKQYICQNFGDASLCCVNTGLSWYYTAEGSDTNETGGTSQIVARLALGLIDSLTMTYPARGTFTQAELNAANGAPVTLPDAQEIANHDEPTEDQWCYTAADDCTSPTGAENSEICGESQYGQDPTHRYKCIGGVWVDQGYDAACDTGVDCSSYTNLNDCAQAGCYWYNGACHDNPPSCEILTSETQCQIYGCYWYNNSCHTNPQNGDGKPCSSYTNQLDCLNANCYWYKKYPWEAESCHDAQQNILMNYLPFIIAGAGGTIIIALLLTGKKKTEYFPVYAPPEGLVKKQKVVILKPAIAEIYPSV